MQTIFANSWYTINQTYFSPLRGALFTWKFATSAVNSSITYTIRIIVAVMQVYAPCIRAWHRALYYKVNMYMVDYDFRHRPVNVTHQLSANRLIEGTWCILKSSTRGVLPTNDLFQRRNEKTWHPILICDNELLLFNVIY